MTEKSDTTIEQQARDLAAKCWGHDGYYDDENGESHEDTRELLSLLRVALNTAFNEGRDVGKVIGWANAEKKVQETLEGLRNAIEQF